MDSNSQFLAHILQLGKDQLLIQSIASKYGPLKRSTGAVAKDAVPKVVAPYCKEHRCYYCNCRLVPERRKG